MSESPEEVERRLSADRAALGETIDAIQDRLSPGQLVDQAMGYIRSGGGDLASSFARSAKQNPWPLVLTGVGLTWLIASTSGTGSRRDDDEPDYRSYPGAQGDEWRESEHDRLLERARLAEAGVSRGPGESEDSFQERVVEARAKALDMKRDAAENAQAFKDRVQQRVREAEEKASELKRRAASGIRGKAQAAGRTAHDMRDRAGAALERGRETLSRQSDSMRERGEAAASRTREFYESEPLVAGAVGVLAGVLVGALLPSSRLEDRYLGRYRKRLGETVAEQAHEVVDRVETVAAEATRAAAEAADEAARQPSSSSAGGRPGGSGSR